LVGVSETQAASAQLRIASRNKRIATNRSP
jgi:hypothetical protein